ncbi:hypothetical protein TNCV_4935651 [Trichonephila clavipes]|nr:hypothetical protein TNCV_4935651 [Trichonephila clavipes]
MVKKIAKRMVHNCRTSLGDPIFYDNFTMQEMKVALEGNVDPHSLKPFSQLKFDSDRIHFQTELLTRVCKGSDIPVFTRQTALETIRGLPHSALKIYTDGSMGDRGISGACTLRHLMAYLTSRLGTLTTVL